MSSEFVCKICAIECTGKAPYEQHLSSAKHIKKAMLNGSQTSLDQSPSINTTSSPSPTITTHTPHTNRNNNIFESLSSASATYSISPETMRILLEWNHPLSYKPYCDICHLELYGENNADIHFKEDNIMHNQKLSEWKKIRENDAPHSCKVCSEIFPNENVMRDHFESDMHAKIVQQKTNLTKIIQIYETYNKLKQLRQQQQQQSTGLTSAGIDDDDLTNRFQSLNVIDATTTTTKPKTQQSNLFNRDNLQQAMRQKLDDDDD